MKRSRKVSILVTTVVVISGYLLLRWWAEGTYRIVEFDCGSGRLIELRSDNWIDGGQPIYYQVYKGGTAQISPESFIDAVSPNINLKSLEWKLLAGSHEDVIGVTESSRPNVVILLFDFSSSNQLSNGTTATAKYEPEQIRMLEVIQQNHQELKLVVSDKAIGSIGGQR